jgi:ankyrin repeat protein
MLPLPKFLLCGLMPLFTLAQTQPAPQQTQSDTTLFRIIRSGNTATLQQKLQAGADPNSTSEGFSALMVATLMGSTDEMRLLLDHGAKVNYADPDSLTALWLAIPDSAKTELLLQHGADPSLLSKDHYSPLVKLVNFPGTTGLFLDLVARGADPKKAATDNSLLYMAAATGDTALVGLLLRYGFLPNDTVFYGDYPLNSALSFRTFPTVKMLIDSGANPNVALPAIPAGLPNTWGMTPLMLAALADDERSFYYLLDHGANVNARSATGYTALMYLELAETDHPALTKALLDHGANPHEKDKNGDDAYTMASKKGNTVSAQLLKH